MKFIAFVFPILTVTLLLFSESALAMPNNPVQEQLLKLNSAQRNIAWTKMFHSRTERCGRVTRTYFQMQDDRGRAYWGIGCSTGRSYFVTINPDKDGSLGMADCALMKRLAGSGCFEKMTDIPPDWRGGD
jgi:hypothetical protein